MRTYNQYCALARALDLVGERWALLVVRELLLGPRRYTDLQAGLPGIGTNVLSSRLRELEEGGVVTRRVLPPPAASTVYELTPYGRELEPAVLALGRWGAGSLGPRPPGQPLHGRWLGLALRGFACPETAAGLDGVLELRLDDAVLHVRFDDGAVSVDEGPALAPDLTIVLGNDTLVAILAGLVAPTDAVAAGAVRVEGDETLVAPMLGAFRAPIPPSPAPAPS